MIHLFTSGTYLKWSNYRYLFLFSEFFLFNHLDQRTYEFYDSSTVKIDVFMWRNVMKYYVNACVNVHTLNYYMLNNSTECKHLINRRTMWIGISQLIFSVIRNVNTQQLSNICFNSCRTHPNEFRMRNVKWNKIHLNGRHFQVVLCNNFEWCVIELWLAMLFLTFSSFTLIHANQINMYSYRLIPLNYRIVWV